jgi:hypothetical protein
MHHAEAQTGGATIIGAMDFARVDYYDVMGSDMIRFAVVLKLHITRINQSNGKFLMPMRFNGISEDVLCMKRIDASI